MPSKRYLRWRREMIDAYYDDRFRQILVPLAVAAHAWEAGEISNSGLMDEVQKANREARSFDAAFIGGHEILERLIRANEPWYAAWVKEHPCPEEDGGE